MGLPDGAVDHGSTVTPLKDHAALAELASLREQIGESGGMPPTPGECSHIIHCWSLSANALRTPRASRRRTWRARSVDGRAPLPADSSSSAAVPML